MLNLRNMIIITLTENRTKFIGNYSYATMMILISKTIEYDYNDYDHDLSASESGEVTLGTIHARPRMTLAGEEVFLYGLTLNVRKMRMIYKIK